MTEDRVPSPLNSLRALWAKKEAMTEDRVPTRTGPRTRDVVVSRLMRDSELTEQEAEAMVNDVEREAAQPAPPLDVERLARAIGAAYGWIPTVKETEADRIAAEYARLGSETV